MLAFPFRWKEDCYISMRYGRIDRFCSYVVTDPPCDGGMGSGVGEMQGSRAGVSGSERLANASR